MIKKKISPQEVIDLLNEALKIDRKAMESLFNMRVFCNKKLAEHNTIQVGKYDKKYFVGIIGILNGIFGVDINGWGCLSIGLTSDNKIKYFTLLEKD